jgi:hypothetical protein
MNSDNDEYIRPPDKPIRECLLSPTNHYNQYSAYSAFSYEDDLARILKESETDYELQLALAESKKIEEEQKAREERATHFAEFRLKIKQLEKIDILNAQFYAEIVQHIDTYELVGIAPIEVTEDFYGRFRKMVDSIRIKPDEKTRLLELTSICGIVLPIGQLHE